MLILHLARQIFRRRIPFLRYPLCLQSPNASQARLDEFERSLQQRFSGFAILQKSQLRSQRAIGRLLSVVTFGAARGYVDHFHTTLGQRIYVCEGWNRMSADDKYILLRHEAVHLAQFQRYTSLGMAALYFGWPLPLGLAYARARLEWAAYAETIAATFEVYGPSALTPAFRAGIVSQFVGPDYGWMWPFRRQVTAWYDAHVAALIASGAN